MRLAWKRLPYALIGLSLGLPLLLVSHAVLATRELQEMRRIFLRDRAATVAARLETLPPRQLADREFDDLFENDPWLWAIRLFPAHGAGSAAVEAIGAGRELYRTEEIQSDGVRIFRAYIPFHTQGEVQVAQVDLNAAAPDFWLGHVRHNLEIAVGSGMLLLAVALIALWNMRRAARLERRKMEMERLAELGRLSAMLAHEIRNPLGTIKGFAQLAHEAAGAGKRPLEAIVRECERLEELVNSLLQYGRPVHPDVRPTEWTVLAGELAAYAHAAIGRRPIEFLSETEIQRFSTDPGLLKEVLLNLIRNAVEAIPEGQAGKIRLRAALSAGQSVVISLEDDGPGLPEAVQASLFAPFLTTKASGTGLGLPISKKLIEALGGTLRLQAVPPHGTRAELALHGANSSH